MELTLYSVTHHKCPVEQREKVRFNEGQRRRVFDKLRSGGVRDAVMLETCNRTELYLYAKKGLASDGFMRELVGQVRPEASEAWAGYSERKQGIDVVRHLFEVAAGLDSQMLGENQILSQVKAAYGESIESSMSGFMFHRLFHQAFRVGKAVRSRTDINCGAVSISLAAVELAKHNVDLAGGCAMVIGAGENAELAARYLLKADAGRLIIANRNPDKARQMRCRLGAGEVTGLGEIMSKLDEVDLVIASTGAAEPVVRYEQVREVLEGRQRPLLLIDIAVPRDIDSRLNEFKCATLVNIDDLSEQIAANRQKRSREVPKAKRIVDEFTEKFARWQGSLDAVPVISRLSKRAAELARAEARRYAKDFGEGNEEKLELFAESLAKKLLHGPISFLKSGAEEETGSEPAEAADLINRMFRADEEREK